MIQGNPMTPLVSLNPLSSIEYGGYSYSSPPREIYYCTQCDIVREAVFLINCPRCKAELRMIGGL